MTQNRMTKHCGRWRCLYGPAIALLCISIPVEIRAEVTCAAYKEFYDTMARYQHVEGGAISETYDFPPGTIASLIVDPTNRTWKIVVNRPDAVTCVLLDGAEWIRPNTPEAQPGDIVLKRGSSVVFPR